MFRKVETCGRYAPQTPRLRTHICNTRRCNSQKEMLAVYVDRTHDLQISIKLIWNEVVYFSLTLSQLS
jgi:hypothetical protein